MNLRVFYPYIITLRLLWLCSAQDLNCNVTQLVGQTLYSFPDFTAVGCEYSWSDGTHIVLANHEDENKELVVMKSDRSLLLRGCFETIHYMCLCVTENVNCEASCTTNCTESIEPSTKPPEAEPEEIGRHHWTVAVPLFLLMVVIMFFWFRKCNNQTCR